MGRGGHEFARGSGLSQGSHVTGKIFGALDRYRGFIKNLVAGEGVTLQWKILKAPRLNRK